MRTIKQLLPLTLAMAVLLLVFGLRSPDLISRENMLGLAEQISKNAILAFGMTLVILIGGIDLSVGALLALVETTTVYILSKGNVEQQNLWWLAFAMLSGIAVAGCFGAFNGLCAAKTKMPPFIITLAMMLVARGAALRFNQGRPMHIPDQQTVFLAIGNGKLFGEIPYPVIIMLTLFAILAILLHRTRFGQHLYAIGGNREAARFTGIPIARNEILVYMICSVLAGLVAMIHSSQLYSAEPAAGNMFELSAIAAVVVGGTSFTGGRGTMVGTLIGAIIIGILDKGLNFAGVHHSWQSIVKGLVILSAVYMDVRRK